MKHIALCCFAVLLLSACGEEGKINKVKATRVPNCKDMTVEQLVGEIMEKPVWGYEETTDGKVSVTANGLLGGQALPEWVGKRGMTNSTFRFALNPKSGEYDASELDKFPSLDADGILRAYKAGTCLK